MDKNTYRGTEKGNLMLSCRSATVQHKMLFPLPNSNSQNSFSQLVITSVDRYTLITTHNDQSFVRPNYSQITAHYIKYRSQNKCIHQPAHRQNQRFLPQLLNFCVMHVYTQCLVVGSSCLTNCLRQWIKWKASSLCSLILAQAIYTHSIDLRQLQSNVQSKYCHSEEQTQQPQMVE